MRIKAKQGYNVILNDINIALQSGRDFIEIDEKLFNKSNDAKKFQHLIEIDTGKAKKTKKADKTPLNIVQTASNIFIADTNQTINTDKSIEEPKPENILDNIEIHQIEKDVIVDTVSVKNEVQKTAKIDDKKIKVEEKKTVNEVKPIKNETKNEVKNEVTKVDAIKTEPVKANEIKSTKNENKVDNKKSSKENKK